MNFPEIIKGLRVKRGLTLRKFCLGNGLDPSNWSKLERGLLAPPRDSETLDKWALLLGLERDTEEWQEFMDAADLERGQVPHDLLASPDLRDRIMSFLKAIRAEQQAGREIRDREPVPRFYAPSSNDDFID